MSHFTVGVFIDNIDDMHCLESCLDGVLAPYQEDASEEYLEFHNLYEENRERYKQESIEMVQLPDGSTIFPWDDDELKKKIPFIVLFDDGDKEKYQEPRWYTRRCLVNNKSCTMCFDLFTANAELLLSPMGISFVSKVAPPKYKGMMMGGWFVATAIGNYLVAIIGYLWGGMQLWMVWSVLIVLCLLSALFMFSIMKKLDKVA